MATSRGVESLVREFRALGGACHAAMALTDDAGRILAVNNAFRSLLGNAGDAAFVATKLRRLIHQDDHRTWERMISLSKRAGPGNEDHGVDIRWLGRSADPLRVRTSIGTLSCTDDVTGTVVYLGEAAQHGAGRGVNGVADILRGPVLYQAIVESTADAIAVADAQGLVYFVNTACAELFRYRRSELTGVNIGRLLAGQFRSTGAPADLNGRLAGVLGTHGASRVDQWGIRGDGSSFAASVDIHAIEGGGAPLSLLRIRDVTDEKRREKQLSYLTRYDLVTGVTNRAMFHDRFEHALRRGEREGRSVVLMHLDLDRFKHINETLGHHAGDEVLREVADRLRLQLRDSDTIARLGGDEFAIVLEGDAAVINGGRIARKLLDAVARPMFVNGRELFPTASLGVSVFAMDGENASDLLRNAEVAMYRAKELGRNTFCFYSPAMNERPLDRLQLESDLRHALERGEYRLYFQPQVRASSGQITAVEALIRWQHPTRGIVSPKEFIPLLEETGLIVPVGAWVLETACRQVRQWEREGLGTLGVAVNISTVQFRDEGFVDVVRAVLDKTGLPPQRLDLEITETILMESTGQSQLALTRLDALGVRISVDDFGIGYSSLAYLKRFPVDTLKIDGSFIAGIPNDQDDVAIATAIIALAERLGLSVIAEAVETDVQLEFLQDWDSMIVQGYLFSPPLAAQQLRDRLREAVGSTPAVMP